MLLPSLKALGHYWQEFVVESAKVHLWTVSHLLSGHNSYLSSLLVQQRLYNCSVLTATNQTDKELISASSAVRAGGLSPSLSYQSRRQTGLEMFPSWHFTSLTTRYCRPLGRLLSLETFSRFPYFVYIELDMSSVIVIKHKRRMALLL